MEIILLHNEYFYFWYQYIFLIFQHHLCTFTLTWAFKSPLDELIVSLTKWRNKTIETIHTPTEEHIYYIMKQTPIIKFTLLTENTLYSDITRHEDSG